MSSWRTTAGVLVSVAGASTLVLSVAGVAGVACGETLGSSDTPEDASPPPSDVATNDTSTNDADTGTTTTTCDPYATFDTFMKVAGLDKPTSTSSDLTAFLSADEYRIYVGRAVDTSTFPYDLYVATRTRTTDQFGPLAPIEALNSDGGNDYAATLTPGLDRIFFASTRGSPIGQAYLFMATRLSDGGGGGGGSIDSFGPPTRLATPDGGGIDRNHPHLARHAAELWHSGWTAPQVSHIFYQPLTSNGEPLSGDPKLVDSIATASASEISPVLSDDGKVLYWASTRQENGKGKNDIWVATRLSTDSPFSDVRNVKELNTTAEDGPFWLSPDQCRLYFGSDRDQPGITRAYVASRQPPTK